MFPFVRMFKEIVVFRNAPKLSLGETHISHHRCWPWDLDFWMELNNGRTLTIYDLGRIPLISRSGMTYKMVRKKYSLTMAGASVRFRRRITAFEKIEMRSRVAYWDDRFVYIEQSMWKVDGECAGHLLMRAALLHKRKLISPTEIIPQRELDKLPKEMPEWVQLWIEAEQKRPWPPMQE